MAQLPVRFDANSVAPAVPLEVLPAGDYIVTITGSEMKPTREQDGSYCAVEATVYSGEHKGRKFYTNLNLVNKNATAVEIAYRELSAICHAVGVFDVQDTQQLHGIPLVAKVGMQPAGKGNDGNMYEARNVIRGWLKADGSSAAPAGAPGAAAPAWVAETPANTAAAPAAQPAAPSQPSAPPVTPAPVVKHGLDAARDDGWLPHPTAPGWHYKGQEVKTDADVAALYPQPAAAAPVAPAGGAGGTPPWQTGTAQPAEAPAAALPQASAASTDAPPPWAQ
jgi:hypothetical protein